MPLLQWICCHGYDALCEIMLCSCADEPFCRRTQSTYATVYIRLKNYLLQ